jgi:hypothetical protein
VLVTVEEIPRPRPQDVIAEALEALVNLRVALMAPGGRVVGDEYIHPRERLQRPPDFVLFIKVMPPRLVAPASIESADKGNRTPDVATLS